MRTSKPEGMKGTDSNGIVENQSYQQFGGGKRFKEAKRAFQKQPVSQPFSALKMCLRVFDSPEKLGYVLTAEV